MFTLINEKHKYFRIKRGQSGEEIFRVLSVPVRGEAFAGKIIRADGSFTIYIAKPGDTLRTLSKKFGIAEEELTDLNGSAPVYPTRKLFIPQNG